jgi:hypothetical protein
MKSNNKFYNKNQYFTKLDINKNILGMVNLQENDCQPKVLIKKLKLEEEEVEEVEEVEEL